MSNERPTPLPGEQSKAGVIRAAAETIKSWRHAGISVAGIARMLSEQSGQSITTLDVYRESYRSRRRREKGSEHTAAPAGERSSSQAAKSEPGELARRAKERTTPTIEFNPKPDPDDLV